MKWRGAIVGLALLVGCGDSEPVTGGGGDSPMDFQPEGPYIEANLLPARSLYRPGIRVKPEAVLRSRDGEAIEDASFSWTVRPASAATPAGDDGRYEIHEEGRITFEVCATAEALSDAVCAEAWLLSDAGPPQVVIDSPEAGAELSGLPGELLEVTGRVTDSHGELRAFLNGEALPLAVDGSFSALIEPRFGVNSLEVTASDGLNVRQGQAGADVMWARDYRQVDAEGGVYLGPGAVIALGRRALDDGVPLDQLAIPRVTHDLADLLELVIVEADLMGNIQDPLVGGAGLQLRVATVSQPEPEVAILVTEQGAEVFVRLPGFVVRTEGFFELPGQRLSLNGDVHLGMSGLAELRIGKAGIDAPYEVELLRFDLAVDDASSDFQSPEADAVFELADGTVRSAIEETLVAAVAAPLAGALPAVVRGTLSSIDSSLQGQRVVFDTGVAPPLPVLLDGYTQAVRPVPGQRVEAVVDLHVRPGASVAAPYMSRGVALRGDDAMDPPLFAGGGLQAAIRLATLNTMLYTLWEGRLLEVDASNLLPDEISFLVTGARMSARLPPVVTPRIPELAPHGLTIGLGQVELNVDFTDQQDVYGLTLFIGADLVVEEEAVVLRIAQEPLVRAWAIDTTGDAPFFDGPSLSNLILTLIWPELRAAFSEDFVVPLPGFDLSGLEAVAPSLGQMTLQLVERRALEIRGDYVVFDGELRGELP